MTDQTPLPRPSRSLRVPDAATEQDFLKLAKQSWREAHRDRVIHRGHPLERTHLFPLIEQELHRLYEKRTFRWPETLRQSDFIDRLLHRMQSGTIPSYNEKSVRKYVRMYRLEHGSINVFKKGLPWLSMHRSPVLSQFTVWMRECSSDVRDIMTTFYWHIVARYALGAGVTSLPSRYRLNRNLEEDSLNQALRESISALGQALLDQHSQRATLETYPFPHLQEQVKGRRFQPLRTPPRHGPRRTHSSRRSR